MYAVTAVQSKLPVSWIVLVMQTVAAEDKNAGSCSWLEKETEDVEFERRQRAREENGRDAFTHHHTLNICKGI